MELERQTSEIRKAWVSWLYEMMPEPVHFITLTYALETHPDKAKKDLFYLIRRINLHELGLKYKKYVKHCYFSYIAVMEYQKRGVVHFHMLADNWLPYTFIHENWNTKSQHGGKRDRGYAQIKQVKDPGNHKSGGSVEGAIRYLAKYLMKDGAEPIIWMKKKYFSLTDFKRDEGLGKVPPILVSTLGTKAKLSSDLFDKEPAQGNV